MKVCSIPNCGRKHQARGYCKKHYETHTNEGRRCKKKYQGKYRNRNRGMLRAYARKYKKTPRGVEVQRAYAERRAKRIKEATMPWTSEAEMNWLQEFATVMHLAMDHCIPLFNDMVCGLHVPDNIQFLTVEQNIKKGNKF